jgi:hypothetical protein
VPIRKLIVTDNRPFGTGENESILVRMQAVNDPQNAEATAMNAGLLSMVVTARLDPATDLSAWIVGQTRDIDINL